MDDQHRAHAERDQDPSVSRAMRALYVSWLYLRTNALAAHRPLLQRGAAVEEGGGRHQGTHSEPVAARDPGAMGGSRARSEPYGAGMGQLLLLWLGFQGAARGTPASVPHGSPLSPPAAKGRRVWFLAVPIGARVRGTGRGSA